MNLLGKPTIEFCEKAGLGLIKRPFYAISNFAYLIVGFLILNKRTKFSKIFGYSAIFIGLASFLYDASYTYASQLLDLFSMLVFVNILIYLSAVRLGKNFKIFCILAPIFGLASIIYFKSYAGEFVFGIFVLIAIVLEIVFWLTGRAKEFRMWLWGFGLFILGFIVWLFDAVFKVCDPDNIINGRSIFHILTAITIFLLYKYSEKQEVY